jgi:hypothetical protein
MLCLTGCATTLDSVWRSPDLRAHNIKSFAVFGQAPRPGGRVAFEQALSSALRQRGFAAIPSYSLMTFDQKPEQAVILERLKGRHVDAVLVSSIIGQQVHVDSYPTGGPVGGPYYHGWYGYMGSYGYSTTVSVEYTVETVLYDLEDQKPLWAARSTTTRKSPADFAEDIADPIADELEDAGLVPHKGAVSAAPPPP